MIKLKKISNSRILNDKVFSAKYLKNLERDEHTLYKLVMDCFNFDPVELTKKLETLARFPYWCC